MELPGPAGGGAGATVAPVVAPGNTSKDPRSKSRSLNSKKTIVPAAETSATPVAVSPAPPRLQPVEVEATVVAPASSGKTVRPGVSAVVQSTPAGKNPPPPRVQEPVRPEAPAASVAEKDCRETLREPGLVGEGFGLDRRHRRSGFRTRAGIYCAASRAGRGQWDWRVKLRAKRFG